MNEKKFELSVLVIIWNNSRTILKCLDSILQKSSDINLEIIAVDNHSTDRSQELIENYSPLIKTIFNSKNLYYTRATNQALKEARGKYILFLNPDTEILNRALQKMLEYMEKNPEISGLGPQLLTPANQIQPSCRTFPDFYTLLWEFSGLACLFPQSTIFGKWKMGDFDFKTLKEVDQPMASALLIRKEVLERVGFLDERFKLFFSDVDFCYRIKKTGGKIIYYPYSQIKHYGAESTSQIPIKKIILSHAGFFKFLAKYKKGIFNKLLLFFFGFGLLITASVRALLIFFRKLKAAQK